jgi:hypothetical protein
MIESHNRYFHDVPVVICGLFQEPTDNLKGDSQFTGTWLVPDPAKTLDVALQLQTDIKRVVVVNGTSLLDRQVENIIRKSLQRYEDRMQFTYLSDLTMASLLAQVRDTPSHAMTTWLQTKNLEPTRLSFPGGSLYRESRAISG